PRSRYSPGGLSVPARRRAAGTRDEPARRDRHGARARVRARRVAGLAHLARDHRPHRRQSEGDAGRAVLRGHGVGPGRARVRRGRTGARRSGGPGGARAAGRPDADPGARRPPRRRPRGRAVVRAAGAAMEVSSHSLDQGRVDGLEFRAALFTNLTRDHLDYHKTLDAYFRAKAKLAQYLAADGLEVVNADDPAWGRLRREHRRVTFGERSGEVTARRVTLDAQGARFELATPMGGAAVRLPLLGRFNVANARARRCGRSPPAG